MRYSRQGRRRWRPKRLFTVVIVGALLLAVAAVTGRYIYNQNLKPVSGSNITQTIAVEEGVTTDEVAKQLDNKGLIRSAWAFKLYVGDKEIISGIYELAPSQGTKEIAAQLTHGSIATNLVTILPGQRLDQLRQRLLQEGFGEDDVFNALNPANYTGHPALADKPERASLEGYLYPDSYQKTGITDASVIVKAALDEMHKHLTTDLRAAFAKQGLSTYEAITLASVVEKEVSAQNDRNQVAQVFLKRLKLGMRLQSDATAPYGAVLAGEEPHSSYSSPYNTYQNAGLPPTPISNVTISSLRAVAQPASTNWLYFVSGDDGVTRFAKTLAEQETHIQQYCKQRCSP